MSLDKSYKRIDKIVTALQGVSTEDLSPLEGLLRVYFLLFKSLKKADSGVLAHIAHECRHVLQLLLEGKASDPTDWLKRLVDSTNQLQLTIYEELEIEEATFSIFELPDIHRPKELSQTAPADAPAAPEPNQTVEAAEPSPAAPPSAEAPPLPPPVEDNPMTDDPELAAEFIAEVEEYLEEAETLLLTLEHEPEDEEALNGIFRAFHTLKGVAGFMGQEVIQHLAHETENLLDMAREKEVVLEGTKFEVTLEARDVIHSLVDDLSRMVRGEPPEGASVPPDLIPRLKAETGGASGPDLASLDAQFETPEPPAAATPEELIPLIPEEPLPPPVEAVSPPPQPPQEAPPASTSSPLILTAANLEAVGDNDMLVDFVEDSTEHLDAAEGHLLTLEKDPENNEALAAVFRGFHTIKGVAGFLALDAVQALAHEAENLLVLARNEEIELVGDALDVTLMARDAMLAIVEDIQAFLSGDKSRVYTVDQLLIQNLLAAQKGSPITRLTSPPPSLSTPAAATSAKKKSKVTKITESLKVDAERLDLLVDMIGELVIAESMILDRPELKFAKSPKLDALLRQLNKITRDLQGLGTSMRLVPIAPVFKRMNRLVREVSKQLGKPVEFSTVGEETELDKSIVDSIADPLVHLLRNAIDHGLEPNSEERIAKGKTAAGKITLSAIQEGGSIKIRVEDDGRGMDRNKILDKAQEKGLVQDGTTLSDKEVFEFIMQPGFSTAAAVTDVSGRGVGMDVVKRNIENLHGTIAIESNLGSGSTFTIQLPLTLAIIDGMVVRVGAERYIIPTLGIARMINYEDTQVERVFGQRDIVNLPEGVFPLFDLQSILNCPPMPASENAASPPMIVLVEDQETRFGLLVDKMLGKQQVVIKPLGDWLGSIPGISGSAIMPDGSVGLIIDVHGVFQLGHGSPTTPPKTALLDKQTENGVENESKPETQASSSGNPSCP